MRFDAAEVLGRPEPRLNPFELAMAQKQREAEKEATPASKADLGRLEQVVTQLKGKLHSLSGRSEQDYSPPRKQAYYLRNSGGPIVRGPH
jgi:hypothetical protein